MVKLLLEYNHKSSMIHNLDPRVKLLWLIGNFSVLIFFQDLALSVFLLGVVLVTNILANISLKVFLPIVKIMTIIGAQIIFFQALLRPEGAIILSLGSLDFYLGGIIVGVKGILLLLTLTFLFLQFVMWTSPEELTLLLVKLGLPQKYSVLVGLALHFLPIIEKDLRIIYDSQQARGIELTTTWQKAKGLLPVMLPLILRALKRAREVALSMELKGYSRFSTRTFLSHLNLSTKDYLVLSTLVIYFGGVILIQV